jgi:biopolymer transport protein ExbB
MVKTKWTGMLAWFCFLLAVNVAFGQTVETTESVERTDSLITLVMKGGVIMIPIFLCSVMAITIMFERSLALGFKVSMPPVLEPELEDALDNSKTGKIGKAKEVLKKHASVQSEMLAVAVDHWDQSLDDVEKMMGDKASLSIRRMRRSIRSLKLIGALSPLLGLLGTVLGMITSFQTVALSSQSINKAELLAEGIYQAMVTTAAGLVVAIPTLVFHFVLNNKIDKTAELLEESGNRFLNKYFRSRLKLEN